ncbi:MAG: lysyl oxidase family protein [Thermoleophilia bacterium]
MHEAHSKRRRRPGPWLATAGLVAAAWVPAASAAYVTTDLPDLVPMSPTLADAQQQTPIFMDTLQKPGRVMYRFDAVVWNRSGAGALDVYRDPATGHAMQIVWSGGIPTTATLPNSPPPATDPHWTAVDRSASGARFFVQEKTWHFSTAALYEILVPHGPPRVSDKVGFCFFDTWGDGATAYFPTVNPSPYGSYWCFQGVDGTTPVRMGISPGLGDFYWSQLEHQWVDVTGLPPGQYTLRSQVNPSGYILEQDATNNQLDDPRTIAGVAADAAAVQTTAGRRASVPLTASIVAPEIPARFSKTGRCKDPDPKLPTATCFRATTAGARLRFTVRHAPAHGRVRIVRGTAQRAKAVYTPARGFTGIDGFTFQATDPRGLPSVPTRVTVQVQRRAPVRVALRGSGPVRVGAPVQLVVGLTGASTAAVTLERITGTRATAVATGTLSGGVGQVAFTPQALGQYVLRARCAVGGRTVYSAPLTLGVAG